MLRRLHQGWSRQGQRAATCPRPGLQEGQQWQRPMRRRRQRSPRQRQQQHLSPLLPPVAARQQQRAMRTSRTQPSGAGRSLRWRLSCGTRCARTAPTTRPGEPGPGLAGRQDGGGGLPGEARGLGSTASACGASAAVLLAPLVPCSAAQLWPCNRVLRGLGVSCSPRLADSLCCLRGHGGVRARPPAHERQPSSVSRLAPPFPRWLPAGTTHWTFAPCGCTRAPTAAQRAPGALRPSCPSGRNRSGSRRVATSELLGLQHPGLLCWPLQCP